MVSASPLSTPGYIPPDPVDFCISKWLMCSLARFISFLSCRLGRVCLGGRNSSWFPLGKYLTRESFSTDHQITVTCRCSCCARKLIAKIMWMIHFALCICLVRWQYMPWTPYLSSGICLFTTTTVDTLLHSSLGILKSCCITTCTKHLSLGLAHWDICLNALLDSV